jgi:hypothetical protein
LRCSKYGWREEKGCGGLLRNSNGQWIGEFSRHLGMCSAYLAELWGVIDGLRLVYDVIVVSQSRRCKWILELWSKH